MLSRPQRNEVIGVTSLVAEFNYFLIHFLNIKKQHLDQRLGSRALKTAGRIVCSGSCEGFAAYGSGLLAQQWKTVELMPPYKVKQECIHMKIMPDSFYSTLFLPSEAFKRSEIEILAKIIERI